MIGYEKGEVFIGVSNMPYRKKPCLVVQQGNCVIKYATFNNEYAAKEFMDIFAGFIGAVRIDWFESEVSNDG